MKDRDYFREARIDIQDKRTKKQQRLEQRRVAQAQFDSDYDNHVPQALSQAEKDFMQEVFPEDLSQLLSQVQNEINSREQNTLRCSVSCKFKLPFDDKQNMLELAKKGEISKNSVFAVDIVYDNNPLIEHRGYFLSFGYNISTQTVTWEMGRDFKENLKRLKQKFPCRCFVKSGAVSLDQNEAVLKFAKILVGPIDKEKYLDR